VRSRTWQTLILIILVTLFAVWVDLPGDTFDVGGFKAGHPVREGLDLQGGLQVVLQARPVAG
jgi:preprotein translocase subunit SecD